MIRINPQFTSSKVVVTEQNKTEKVDKNISNPIKEKSDIARLIPDYSVKTPLVYQKLSEFKLPFDLNASLYKFSNGQRVVIIPKEGKTVLKTYVNTGSMNEPDKLRGISHYIEHNLFNGSEGLESGEFFKKVDEMGASTNASTGFSQTDYFISSNLLKANDLEEKIKLHASMLETPKFAVEMLEKEKGIVNSEINMITADPLNIAINKTIKNLYHIDTTSLDLIGGTTSNITNLTRDDVVNYFNNNYYPANMVTVLTGEVNPEETMKLLSKYFSSKKHIPSSRHFEELKPTQVPIREDIISDKATATSIVLAFDGPKNNDAEEKVLAQAIAQILTMSKTSRIDKKLKDFNSSAFTEIERISSDNNANRAILMLSEGTEANSEKIIKTIYTEISRLAQNPPSEEELDIVKKRMLKGFSNIFEHSSMMNSIVGGAFQDNDLNLITKYEQIVNSLTPDKISKGVKRYLDLNKVALTVVHPATATEDSIKANYKNASAIAFTGSVNPKQAINLTDVKEYKLQNNFSVVLHDSNNNNATLRLLYKNDKFPSDLKPGTAELLLKILNAGTMKKTEQQFQSELDKKSVNTYFVSGESDLQSKSTFFADDMQDVLKTTKEVLLTPRFTEATLAKMKSELKDEIETSDKSARDKLIPELFNGLPIGYSKSDILSSIDNVTLDDVKALHKYIIENGQANVVVSAPFSKKPELKQILFNEIAELPTVKEKNFDMQKIYSPQKEQKVLTDVHNKPQAEIIKAYKFPVNQNLKDEITLNILNTILGANPSSRLFQDLREAQKLAYAVRSGFSITGDTGVMTLSIKTTTENKETGEVSYENLQKSINGFNKHINRIMSENVTEKELENAKLSIKNSILNMNETNGGKNKSIQAGLISPYGISQENQILKLIDEITVEDINNAAKYVFSGKSVYSILATENTLKENKKYLDNLV